jgi:hypothetical protein
LKRLENFCVRGFAASPQLYPVGPDWFNYRFVYGYFVFKGKETNMPVYIVRLSLLRNGSVRTFPPQRIHERKKKCVIAQFADCTSSDCK